MTKISDPLFSKAPHSKLSAIEVTLVVQSTALCCTFFPLEYVLLCMAATNWCGFTPTEGVDQAVKGSLLYLDFLTFWMFYSNPKVLICIGS